MKLRTNVRLMMVFLVLSTLTTACGLGNPSRTQFTSRADAICERVSEATMPTALQLFAVQPTPLELAKYLRRLVPILENGFSQLRRLQPPEGDKAKVQEMLAAGTNEIARFNAYAARAAAGDQPRTEDFFNSEPFANFKRLAGEYGATGCATKSVGQDQTNASDGPLPALPPGHQAILDRGDAICEQSGALADALYFQELSYYRYLTSAPPTLPLWGGLLGRTNGTPTDGTTVTAFYQEVKALQGLPFPDADKGRLAGIFHSYDVLGAKAADAGNRAQAGDDQGFRRDFSSVAARSAPLDDALRNYGFTTCPVADSLLIGRVARNVFRLP